MYNWRKMFCKVRIEWKKFEKTLPLMNWQKSFDYVSEFLKINEFLR